MSRAQRLTFLAIAAAIAVVAVVVLAGRGDDGATGRNAAATATATATAKPEKASPRKTATPEPLPLLTAGKVTDLKVRQGDTVRFRVRSPTDEEVHVHGYDLMRDVTAGRSATMSFKADITGVFEIEFEHSAEQIARLTVEPR